MLMVGGTRRSCSAKTQAMDSTCSRGAQQVTSHRLGGGHRDVDAASSPSAAANGERLGDIALRGACAVGVDVDDVGRRSLGVGDGRAPSRARRPCPRVLAARCGDRRR